MKKFFKILALSLVLVPCAFIFAACGNNDYTINAAKDDVQEFEAVSSALNDKVEEDSTNKETLDATLEIKIAISGINSAIETIQTSIDSFNDIYDQAKELANQWGVDVEEYLKQAGLTFEKNGNSFNLTYNDNYSIEVKSSNNKIEISYNNEKDSTQNSSIVIEKSSDNSSFKLNAQIAGSATQIVEVVRTNEGLAFQTSTKVDSIYKTTQVKVGYSYDKENNSATITAYTTKTIETENAPSSIFGISTLPADFAIPKNA